MLYFIISEQDLLPRKYCCGLADDEAFCGYYEEKRPPGICNGFLPPRTSKSKVNY